MQKIIRQGFTLVELLVVISIIGILIALLMPAVNAARESARRITCANNCKQMALACASHESKYHQFPTGGWDGRWAGVPGRGITYRQPGGWLYNILPFMELDNLHELGRNDADKEFGSDKAKTTERVMTVVAQFLCPTRHRVQTFPYTPPSTVKPYLNAAPSSVIGRSDYAANGGDKPQCKFDQDALSSLSKHDSGGNIAVNDDGGVIFQRSTIVPASIKDGLSSTYLLGERYLDANHYLDGSDDSNSLGWDVGYFYDVIRWVSAAPYLDSRTRGQQKMSFGSAHPAGFNMAFCDGSVKKINFGINADTHRLLGCRNDGSKVDITEITRGD